MKFWYDGQLFDPDDEAAAQQLPGAGLFDSVGLRFGATVFTTLRVYDGDLDHPSTQWLAHRDRLERSLGQFGWCGPDWSSVRAGCFQLAAIAPILRIALFPDGCEWIAGRPLSPQLGERQRGGIACWVAPPEYARSLPAHKTGNYLACWLARQQAERHSAQEAILTDARGRWLETSTGNLWGWGRGQWWTPAGDRCLPGLMRSRLQRLLQAAGQQVSGAPWSLALIADLEAIAYSNCAVELLPAHTIFHGPTTLVYDPQHASIRALRSHLANAANRSL